MRNLIQLGQVSMETKGGAVRCNPAFSDSEEFYDHLCPHGAPGICVRSEDTQAELCWRVTP
jgi:hypothetical protein